MKKDKVLDKIISFTINKRYFFFGFFVAFAIVSVFLLQFVVTNYDTTIYLEEGSPTRESVDIMNNEFKMNGSFFIMVEDINDEIEANEVMNKILNVEGVTSVVFDFDSEANYKDECALYSVFLEKDNFDIGAKASLDGVLGALSDYKVYTTGGTVESQYLGTSVNNNMAAIMIVACIVVFLILMLNSISWAEPIVFLCVIGVSIIINLGTNCILPSISFVTKSICAVMQLALAMDYSIILLHRYMEEKGNNPDGSDVSAIKIALKESMIPILGSSLTTIAGLIALTCMKFTMGADIGIVLAKGVVISLLTVFFFMPCVLLLFSKLIIRTKHKSIYEVIRSKFPKFEKNVAKYQFKSRFVLPIILGVLIVAGYVVYLNVDYAYTLEASTDPNSSINLDMKHIEEKFGVQNTMAILVPKGDIESEKEAVKLLSEYKENGENVFTSVSSLASTGIYDNYTPEELANTYGISFDLVSEIYDKISSTQEKMKLIDVLNYINENDYIDTYGKELQAEYDLLYNQSKILNEKVDAEGLISLLKEMGYGFLSKGNAESIINEVKVIAGSDLTFKTLLTIAANKKLFTNVINEYQEYCNLVSDLEKTFTRETIDEVISLSEEMKNEIFTTSTLELKDIVLYLNTKVESSEEISFDRELVDKYILVYNTKDEQLTINTVLTYDKFHFSMFPQILYLTIFGRERTLSVYDIQKKMIESSTVINSINSIQTMVDEKQSLVEMFDTKYTLESFSSAFGLTLDMAKPIFGSSTELFGSEIISVVFEKRMIEVIASDLGETFEKLFEKINYGKAMFESENYSRIVMNLRYGRSSDEALEVCRNLRTLLSDEKIYDKYYVVSESGAFIDFEDTFASDSVKINIISFLFILIIISISFKSLIIPIILTVIIQGAIWLTMAISVIEHSEIYFICYLMVVCIQMGTTIDYGILYTNKYIDARKEHGKLESLEIAFKNSITTILTSGSILVVAAFLVGWISEVSIISSIGYLLSKGTLISIVFILIALPQVLILFDKVIKKTSYKYEMFEETIDDKICNADIEGKKEE